MQKKKTEEIVVDKRPTMAEWPVRIWAMEEIPEIFDLEARKSMKGTFNQYHMVYSPIRRTAPDSFEYMFGYGEGEIFYLKNEKNKVRRIVLKCSQIEEIYTQRELLNAKIIVKYKADLQDRELETLEFPYIPPMFLGKFHQQIIAFHKVGTCSSDLRNLCLHLQSRHIHVRKNCTKKARLCTIMCWQLTDWETVSEIINIPQNSTDTSGCRGKRYWKSGWKFR